MRILIAHDGSDCSNAILQDLRRAGLPRYVDARIVTVAEVPAPTLVSAEGFMMPVSGYQFEEIAELTDSAVRESQQNASSVKLAVKEIFPDWHVDTHVFEGSASTAILREADCWHPDLIIVGSHGRTGIRKMLLGSVSQRVMIETRCAVRIVHAHEHASSDPLRILIACDGSDDANKAVRTVLAREFPPTTEIHLVSAVDLTAVSVVDYLSTAMHQLVEQSAEEDSFWIMRLLNEYKGLLETKYPVVHTVVTVGHPKSVILQRAEQIAADMIFLGARGKSGFERFILGSVSAAVAQRASATVEIVHAS